MPPKTVQCSICNEQVSKRKTIMLPDGKRCCRTHDEVETFQLDQQIANLEHEIFRMEQEVQFEIKVEVFIKMAIVKWKVYHMPLLVIEAQMHNLFDSRQEMRYAVHRLECVINNGITDMQLADAIMHYKRWQQLIKKIDNEIKQEERELTNDRY